MDDRQYRELFDAILNLQGATELGFRQVDFRFTELRGGMDHRFAEVRREMNVRFEQMDKRFHEMSDDMNRRFDAVDARLAVVEHR